MSDVFFPIVGCGQARLATVRCDRLDPRHYPAGRALVLARDEQEIERILADARATESTGAEIARPIWVRFTPQQFTGRSYGLALALADKLARYQKSDETGPGRLFATGIVDEDGGGRIGEVEAFHDKLAAIAEEAGPGDVVVFPKSNAERASPGERDLLDRLDRRGVICRSAGSLDELRDLYEQPASDGPAAAAQDTSMKDERAFAQASTPGEAGDAAKVASSSRRPHRAAIMSLVLMLTAACAFVAGDWSRDRKLAVLQANVSRAAEDGTGVNLLQNPSFEQGEGQVPIGWRTYSRGEYDHADRVRPGGLDGNLVLEHDNDKAFYVDTHQVLQVESGFYALSAWIDSNGGRKANRMLARGDELIEVDIPATAPGSFQELRIHCIEVTKGRLAVGFYMDGYKDSWAVYDDVELVENSQTADGWDCIDVAASGEPASRTDTGENLLVNPSFEQGRDQEPVGWDTFSRGKHDDADKVRPGGVHGNLTLEHGGDQAFYVDTYQIVAVSNGYYALSAMISSDGEKYANRMYARGGELFEADIPGTAHDGYEKLRIDCIQATEERLVVGFYTDTHRSGHTAYDDVQLVPDDRTVDGRACAEN